MRKIIVLGGETQSGKDTFAKPLIDRGFLHGSFAGNLKEMCQYAFNLSPYMTDTQEGKMKKLNPPIPFTKNILESIAQWISRTHNLTTVANKLKYIENEYLHEYVHKHEAPLYFYTPREILQFVGTEICRHVSNNYHVEVLLNKIQDKPESSWVITDARFENERKVLKEKFGAILVRIKRPKVINDKVDLHAGIPAHASENSFGEDSEYDLIIHNNGSIQELRTQAINLI